MGSIARRPDGTYRPRYRDERGKEHARHFKRKVDAQRWLDEVTAAVQTGTYVDPKRARTTVGELAPVWLMSAALLPLAWCVIRPTRSSLRVLQLTMLLFVAIGALGVLLHYRANIDWERESNPSLAGLELYLKAFKGATPMLAPGAMVQLGLVGLVFAFRHPALGRPTNGPNHETEETS